MKAILTFIILLSTLLNLEAGDTNYKDQPMGLTIDMVKLMEPYEKKAQESFHIFEEAFAEKSDRTFYLVTRIYQDDLYEQIFVRTKKKSESVYIGTIASSPMGRVKFSEGDTIKVSKEDIHDWLIVNKDGTEEGNYQGKAMDLLQAGVAVFIARWQPEDGKFKEFEIISVQNPQTKQEIINIIPIEVIEKVDKHVTTEVSGRVSKDGKEKYGYTLVKFPSWEILENEK